MFKCFHHLVIIGVFTSSAVAQLGSNVAGTSHPDGWNLMFSTSDAAGVSQHPSGFSSGRFTPTSPSTILSDKEVNGWFAWSQAGLVSLGFPDDQPVGDLSQERRIALADGRRLTFTYASPPVFNEEPITRKSPVWQLIRLNGVGVEHSNSFAILHRPKGEAARVAVQQGQLAPWVSNANVSLQTIMHQLSDSDSSGLLALPTGDIVFVASAAGDQVGGNGERRGLWRCTPVGQLTLVYGGAHGGESADLWRDLPASEFTNWSLLGSGRSTRWVVVQQGASGQTQKRFAVGRLSGEGRLVGAFRNDKGIQVVVPSLPAALTLEKIWAGSDENLYMLGRAVRQGVPREVAGVPVAGASTVEVELWTVNEAGVASRLAIPANSKADAGQPKEWILHELDGNLILCSDIRKQWTELWLLGSEDIKIALRVGDEVDHGKISFFNRRFADANGSFVAECWIEPLPGSNMVPAHSALLGGRPGDARVLVSTAAVSGQQNYVGFQAHGLDARGHVLVTLQPFIARSDGGTIKLP
jgi:hypothetical protein